MSPSFMHHHLVRSSEPLPALVANVGFLERVYRTSVVDKFLLCDKAFTTIKALMSSDSSAVDYSVLPEIKRMPAFFSIWNEILFWQIMNTLILWTIWKSSHTPNTEDLESYAFDGDNVRLTLSWMILSTCHMCRLSL